MISAVGLVKRYRAVTAVNGVDCAARPGMVTAVLGPNGSGKSTLLRLLAGVLRADEGQVLIDGRPLAAVTTLAGVVGSSLDGVGIHPRWSVQEQLGIVAPLASASSRQVEGIIDECGLGDIRHMRGSALSLGMRQRVGVAMSLLGDPSCLLLDEPANGLDPGSMRWLRCMLRSRASAGAAVMVSSHLMSEVAQIADRVLIIARGSVVWDSSLDDFLATHSRPAVCIDGRGLAQLAERLTGRGVEVRRGAGGLRVIGMSREDVGLLAHDCGCAVTLLRDETPSLEDVYLDFLESIIAGNHDSHGGDDSGRWGGVRT